jgi:hypothetical protein
VLVWHSLTSSFLNKRRRWDVSYLDSSILAIVAIAMNAMAISAVVTTECIVNVVCQYSKPVYLGNGWCRCGGGFQHESFIILLRGKEGRV